MFVVSNVAICIVVDVVGVVVVCLTWCVQLFVVSGVVIVGVVDMYVVIFHCAAIAAVWNWLASRL